MQEERLEKLELNVEALKQHLREIGQRLQVLEGGSDDADWCYVDQESNVTWRRHPDPCRYCGSDLGKRCECDPCCTGCGELFSMGCACEKPGKGYWRA